MQLKHHFKLAAYNLWRRKKTTAQCMAMISAIMLLIFLSAFFITTLVSQLNDSLDNYASNNHIILEHHGVWEGSELIYDEVLLDDEMQTALRGKFSSVGDINYYQGFNMGVGSATLQTLIVGGVEYEGDGTNSEFPWYEVVLKDVAVPTFSENMRTEFSKKFAGEKLIKYGRDIENANELLYPEEFLVAYNLTAEQLLGAENVSCTNMFKNVKVVGITNGNITLMSPDEFGNRDDSCKITIYAEKSVVFAYEPDDMNDKQSVYDPYTYQRIELNGSAQADEIMEYLEQLLGERYWLSFANQGKKNSLDAAAKVLVFVQNIVWVLLSVIGVALCTFLYSVLSHNIKQKGAYLGVTRAMGLESNLYILLFEIIIITVICSIISLLIASAAVFALRGTVFYFSWTSRYTFTLSLRLFAITFLLSFLAVLSLNIALVLLSSRNENKKSIITALRS